MILAAKSDLALVFATPMCNTRQTCYEEVKWKLADDVIFGVLLFVLGIWIGLWTLLRDFGI